MKTINPLNKDFKLMVIKIINKLERRMGEHSEIFNKEIENIRKFQIEFIELRNKIS